MDTLHHGKRNAHAHRPAPRRRYGRTGRDSGTPEGNAALGKARNHLAEVLAHADLPASRYRVAFYIEREILGWGRLWDNRSTARIAAALDVSTSTVWRALGDLEAVGAIVVTREEESGHQRIEVVVPDAEKRDRDVRDETGNVIANGATQYLIGDSLIGGDGNVIEEAQPVTTPAAPAAETEPETTAELVAALSRTADPTDVDRAVTAIERATVRGWHHLRAMLDERGRGQHQWPRDVAAEVAKRANRDTTARYNRPTCDDCGGCGMTLALDSTVATPCPTCRPGTAPPSTGPSPSSSTLAQTRTAGSSPTPTGPSLTPPGSPRLEPHSMRHADAAGIEWARGMLAGSPSPKVEKLESSLSSRAEG